MSIQFDSFFDRWPVIDTDHDDSLVNRVFDGHRTCTYKVTAPLLTSQKIFSGIQCRPSVPNCNIFCSVNLRHRMSGPSGTSNRVRSPTLCQTEQGNKTKTLYLYLLFRFVLDACLLTGHTLIEAIRIANTNNYDAFYAGPERFWTLVLCFIVWPPVCGALSDYFVQVDAPNYSPPVIIFDGFIAITIFLIIMLPLSSTQNKNNASHQKLALQPTSFRYPRVHTSQYLFYRLSLLFPLVLILGIFWGMNDSLVRPFYRQTLHSSNALIGIAFSSSFVVAAVFAYNSKSVLSGIGRMHLILLALIFYTLHNAGISFLVSKTWAQTWLLLPFEMMSAFCLPLTWIGITAYAQHMIKRSPNGLTYASGTTIFQAYSPHVIMQYTLSLIHFGGGRALGSAFGYIWLTIWPDMYEQWLWLTDIDQKSLDNYALEAMVAQDSAVRVLFRLSAIVALSFAIIFFCLYHSCCLNFLIPHHMKQPLQTRHKETNSQHYLKLRSKSENEVYPLRSKSERGSPKPNGNSSTTRSMLTLREESNFETSVDDDSCSYGFDRKDLIHF